MFGFGKKKLTKEQLERAVSISLAVADDMFAAGRTLDEIQLQLVQNFAATDDLTNAEIAELVHNIMKAFVAHAALARVAAAESSSLGPSGAFVDVSEKTHVFKAEAPEWKKPKAS
jgi:hypothetical protein